VVDVVLLLVVELEVEVDDVELDVVVDEAEVVVVVVDEVVTGGAVVAVVVVVGTSCWMKGSLLLKVEYQSAPAKITLVEVVPPAGALVTTGACRKVLALGPPSPAPMHPANAIIVAAMRSAPTRR
jgi:hypothetical protein